MSGACDRRNVALAWEWVHHASRVAQQILPGSLHLRPASIMNYLARCQPHLDSNNLHRFPFSFSLSLFPVDKSCCYSAPAGRGRDREAVSLRLGRPAGGQCSWVGYLTKRPFNVSVGDQ